MDEFKPPVLLRRPNLQSIVARVGVRRARVRRAAEPLLAASEDVIADVGNGVRLLIHHTRPGARANGRVVVLLHGWEGSAMATYVLSAALRLWRQGYRIVRVNMRDHGASHHLNEELFHSCRLDEMADAVRWVQAGFPGEPVELVGSSLGGNFALRIAADFGLGLRHVVAICPVLDPERTMVALDHGSPLYQWYFMRKWRRSLEAKKAAFPGRYDFTQLERFATLEEMTDYFVRHYTEYPDLLTYLRGYALTGDRLRSLGVPSTILLAADDPVIPIDSLPQLARPESLRVVTSRYGGHCGFIADYRLTGWSDQFTVEVLRS